MAVMQLYPYWETKNFRVPVEFRRGKLCLDIKASQSRVHWTLMLACLQVAICSSVTILDGWKLEDLEL